MKLIIFIITIIWVSLLILSVCIVKKMLNPIGADISKLKTDRNINNIMKENKRIIKRLIKEASEKGCYSVTISDGDYYFDSLMNDHTIKNLFKYENELNSLINELKSKGYYVTLDEDGYSWNKNIKISWGEENDK